MTYPIKAALFDKDGTLFDFAATWNAWAKATLLDLTNGDAVRAKTVGALMDFDFTAGAFDPESEVIAGTPDDIIRLLSPGLPEIPRDALLERINRAAAQAPQVETVPLQPWIAELRALGLKIGVATNDAEAPARAHLSSAGVEDLFDFIAGYDSGYGGKPAPGMCLGFAEAMGVAPDAVVMVGDSTHDLLAGRAAQMRTVAVLTGMAGEADLAPYADVVLPSIGALPAWIAAQG